MALSISSTAPAATIFSNSQFNRFRVVTVKCESKEPPPETGLRLPAKSSKLEIGSPVIVTEAPKMIKTAASVPCLRVNSGLVNPGDVGRIVSRKPKDVWAVRLTIGTYLIDGKYFEPLQLDE
ncbi:protein CHLORORESPIRATORY REDUCTION 42, chloroplastic [Corylus avellana]|uniref:protein CHLORORESPIRATORY REDUCTION 42, chloroplastic n=1 Tax=Corylus avellana TaxID=13451 RepID=UPI001E1F0231|nr:protein CHLORORESPIRATORY REDUCTION 42, chloroplastic [Corylus avellana]